MAPFVTSILFLVIMVHLVAGFEGEITELHSTVFKADTQKDEQLHLGDKVCVLSFAHQSWECGRGDKANRGLVVKESGAMVTFNNRVTGWIRARKASHVIYPGGGIKMVEEGGRVVFRHVVSHSEASFPKQATVTVTSDTMASDTMASGTPQARTIDFVQRDFVEVVQIIAEASYVLSFVSRRWQLQLASRACAIPVVFVCAEGVALVTDGNGQLSWEMFGFWSRDTRRRVLAVICPRGFGISKEDGMAVFTYQSKKKTLPVKLLLDLSTKVPIGFYYIPYRPDGSGDQEPGFVKVPAEQPCSLVYQSENWECQQIPKRRGLCGLRRGLVLKLDWDKNHKGVLKYTRLSSIGSKDYAAFIVAGKKVTITRSPPGYVTFTDQVTGQTAGFAINVPWQYLPVRDVNNEKDVAFAKGQIAPLGCSKTRETRGSGWRSKLWWSIKEASYKKAQLQYNRPTPAD